MWLNASLKLNANPMVYCRSLKLGLHVSSASAERDILFRFPLNCFCLLGNRTHNWERMFWTSVQDHSFIQTLHAHSHTSLVSSGRWDDAILYMWMRRNVWAAGGPAVPDPWGQNVRENPAGNISLNPLFIHFQSVCQVAAEYKCVQWPPH